MILLLPLLDLNLEQVNYAFVLIFFRVDNNLEADSALKSLD